MEEREVMEVDVLFVGAGVATLSSALHLMNLIKQHNEKVASGGEGQAMDEVMIAVLEKGPYIGAHNLSGAVIDPGPLKELVPDYAEKGAPLDSEVIGEEICMLTATGRIKAPFTPPPLDNHGNYVVSLAKLTEWLGGLVEAEGVYMFPGFAGTEILYEDNRVVGVRSGDKGIDAQGNQKGNYEPGIDLKGKVTVFGEGTRGSLAKQLIKKYNLMADKNPDNYVVGVKEVWEIPEGNFKAGQVIHTMGYPLKPDTYGGGFVYGMANNMVALGLLVGLDYANPYLDPHLEYQKFKSHPYIAQIIKGGKLSQYGAKTAPVGGYFSVPKLAVDGGVLVGDSANLFISQKIKGVHVAMKSGMLAAETIFEGMLKGDFSAAQLGKYEKALYADKVGKDMYVARNFHQAFQGGLYMAMPKLALQYVLGGKVLKERLPANPDYTHMHKVKDVYGTETPTDAQRGLIKFDGQVTFDKETDVYYSGSTHEEQQPSHLKILDLDVCYSKCWPLYKAPCVRFCPAAVYEMEVNEETGKPEMKINFSNCLHCKTCDVKDPFENILWVPPEGGGGPKYTVV